MGVPAFFRWLCSRNPKALLEMAENSDDNFDYTCNPEIDNLYLDMNGIIHPCSHPEGTGIPIPVTYHDMFINVFNYIDRLVDIIRPQKLIYMAVDGVAPRAKMNQQRSRRFRAAQESVRIQCEKQRLRDYWATQGLQNEVLDEYIQNHFDSNQITPGTDFMHQLSFALQYYIYDRLNNHPLFKNLIIIFSDASIPGEGEHKILQYIRDQRCQLNYNPNLRHCLYGADADLIMLGLSTHEPWFYIIRETIMGNDDKFCTICQSKGHFFTNCPRRDIQIELNMDIKVENKKVKIIQVNFQMIQLSIVREFLKYEMRELADVDLERIIDDFIFMCFLVGNDFLPHIPCLRITDGGIDCLLLIYKAIFTLMGNYITNCGELNLIPLNIFLHHVGLVEEDLIKGQDKKKEINNNRRRDNQQQQQQQQTEINVLDDKQDILDKFKSQLKDKIQEMNTQEITNAQNNQQSHVSKKWSFLSNKQRYYQEKFGVKANQFLEFINQIKQSYLEALAWCLKYYYNGCVDWGWYYPYHYAPFAQDLCNIDQLTFNFELNQPFSPYQQLMAVLPPQSAQFLPKQYQHMMLESQSQIADFYPCDFYVDLKGKKYAWLGEVVLPFVDANRLLVESKKVQSQSLTRYEQERDKLGQVLLYIHSKDHKENLNFQNGSILVKVEWLQRFPLGVDIRSPIPTMMHIQNNQIVTGALVNQLIEKNEQFIQNKVLHHCIEPLAALDDYYMGQCDSNRRSFGGEAVKRIVHSIIRNSNSRPYRRQDQYEQRTEKRIKHNK